MQLHDMGFHHNVSVVARYSCSTPILDYSFIFVALRQAIQRHPALGVTVSGKNTPRPYFLRLGGIDLSKIISFVEVPADNEARQKVLDRVLSEQNSIGFNIDGLPLWRIVVLHQREAESPSAVDLAFVWHHVIADGLSGLVFHSTILRILNSVIEQKELVHFSPRGSQTVIPDGLAIAPTSAKPLFPPIEDILSLSMSMMGRITQVYKSWLGSWFASNEAGKWSGSPYHCNAPIRTQIRQISIPADSVDRLVKRCRSEQTSVTAFLQTLVGKIITEVFADADRLRCAVAISLRRFFPPEYGIGDDVMGLWISAFHLEYTRHALQGEQGVIFPWVQARKSKLRIEQEIAKGDKDVEIGMLRHIKDFGSFLMDKMGRKREDSYAITNLGVFDGAASENAMIGKGPNRQWCISNIAFSQSCHVTGSAMQFCIASVKDGDMVIALSWQEGAVLVTDADRVARELREKLLQLSSSSSDF
jgi:Alcohol acetyltransferase